MPEFSQIDRDLLIKHDVKLSQVCKTMQKMDAKLDKLDDKIDTNSKTYVSKKIFLAINGIIIFLVISLFGYAATVNKQVITNTVNIEHMRDK